MILVKKGLIREAQTPFWGGSPAYILYETILSKLWLHGVGHSDGHQTVNKPLRFLASHDLDA